MLGKYWRNGCVECRTKRLLNQANPHFTNGGTRLNFIETQQENISFMLFLLQIQGRHPHEIQVAWLWVVNALLLFNVSVVLLQNCASVGPYVSYDRMDNLLLLIYFGIET
jgi:hypothetical protein